MRPAVGENPLEVQEFALIDIAGQCIGVPAQCVVQAIDRPHDLTLLPRRKNALEGIFLYRGQVVPLISLARWMQPEGNLIDAHSARQVLVLRVEDRVFGVLVNAVRGLMKVSPNDVRKVHHDADSGEFFHSVALAQDGNALVSLLDPMRLSVQAQVWALAESTQPMDNIRQPGTVESEKKSDAASDLFAVVKLGTVLVALPASAVGEVVSKPVLQKIAGLGNDFLGMTQWRTRDVPVLEISSILGLPLAGSRPAQWLLVLDTGGQALGFYVDDICAVRSFDRGSIQTADAAATGIEHFCHGSFLQDTGERVHLLEPQLLLEASPLSKAIAAHARGTHAEALRSGHLGKSYEGALVVFRSKQTWAAPMHQMREIVALPGALHRTPATDEGICASMEWRGQLVPVIDLREILESQSTQATSAARIIFLQAGSRTAGLLVEEVLALIPGHTATRARLQFNRQPVDMVTVGTGSEQRSYQLIELQKLHFFTKDAVPNSSDCAA